MGYFYIETDQGVTYELSSTPSVKYVESGSVTDHVIEDGSTISDHYKQLPVRIDYSGTITSADLKLSPRQFARGLVALKRDVIFVTAYSTSLLYGTAKCLIENITFEHTPKRGVIRGSISSRVSFTLRQVRLTELASVEPIPAENFKEMLAEKEKASAETAKQSDKDKASDRYWFPITRDLATEFTSDKSADTGAEEVQ